MLTRFQNDILSIKNEERKNRIFVSFVYSDDSSLYGAHVIDYSLGWF